jgi:hypothetical protein
LRIADGEEQHVKRLKVGTYRYRWCCSCPSRGVDTLLSQQIGVRGGGEVQQVFHGLIHVATRQLDYVDRHLARHLFLLQVVRGQRLQVAGVAHVEQHLAQLLHVPAVIALLL